MKKSKKKKEHKNKGNIIYRIAPRAERIPISTCERARIVSAQKSEREKREERERERERERDGRVFRAHHHPPALLL